MLRLVVVLIFLFFLLEGTTRVALNIRDVVRVDPRLIQVKDHDIYGWVNESNLAIDDYFGSDRHFHSNDVGMRGSQIYKLSKPEGIVRLIAAGDSFTEGHGVADEEAWPFVLQSLIGHAEVINIGQGGYGADQAFLRLSETANTYQHDVMLFCLIADDFRRMGVRKNKPWLQIFEDKLTVNGTPVVRSLDNNFQFSDILGAMNRTSVAEVIRLFSVTSRPETGPINVASVPKAVVDNQKLVEFMIRDLKVLAKQQNSQLVTVYFPTQIELTHDIRDSRRDLFKSAAKLQGSHHIDLTDDLTTADNDVVRSLFIKKGEVDMPLSAGHYSIAGNHKVAELILGHLHQMGIIQSD